MNSKNYVDSEAYVDGDGEPKMRYMLRDGTGKFIKFIGVDVQDDWVPYIDHALPPAKVEETGDNECDICSGLNSKPCPECGRWL